MRVFVDAHGLLDPEAADAPAGLGRRARDRRGLVARLAISDPMREWVMLAPPGAERRVGYAELAAVLRVETTPEAAHDPSAAGGPLARALAYADFIDDLASRDDLYWNLSPLDLSGVFPGALAMPRVMVTLDDCGAWARPQRLGGGISASELRGHRARLQAVSSAADAIVFSSRAAEAEGSLATAPGLFGAEVIPLWGDLDPAFQPAGARADPTSAGAFALLLADGVSSAQFPTLTQRALAAIKSQGAMSLAVIGPDGRIAPPGTLLGDGAPAPAEPPLLDVERALWMRRARVVIVGSDDLVYSARSCLEALACGRPVLAPDRPAPREAGGANVGTFDPERVESLVEALGQALRDDSPTASADRQAVAARRCGPDPAGAYRRLLDDASRPPASLGAPPRIAILGPWPPQRSPVAVYVRRMAEAMRAHGAVEVYVEGEENELASAPEGVTLATIDQFPGGGEFDRVFVHLANSPTLHAKSFAIAYRTPGVELIMHEGRLHPLARALHSGGSAPAVYLHALEHLYSKHFIERHQRDGFAALSLDEGVLIGDLAYSARRIIVHSRVAARAIEEERAGESGEQPANAAPIAIAPHPIAATPSLAASPRDPTAFVLGMLLTDPGGLASADGALALAATRGLGKLGLPVRLRVFRAESAVEERRGDAPALHDADLRGLSVELVAARHDVDAAPDLIERLSGCDLWLSLSSPFGGVDRGLLMGLEAGIPCLAIHSDEHSAALDGLARRVAVERSDEHAAETLTFAVAELLLDADRRVALAAAAARHAAAHHSWPAFAESAIFDG